MNRRNFILAASGLLVPPEPVVKRAWWFLGGAPWSFFGQSPLVDPLVDARDFPELICGAGDALVFTNGVWGVMRLSNNIELTAKGRILA